MYQAVKRLKTPRSCSGPCRVKGPKPCIEPPAISEDEVKSEEREMDTQNPRLRFITFGVRKDNPRSDPSFGGMGIPKNI